MTTEQRKLIYKIGEEIRGMEGGSHIEIYANIDTVRIQHTKIGKAYRMFVVLQNYREKQIRDTMFSLFEEIKKEMKK